MYNDRVSGGLKKANAKHKPLNRGRLIAVAVAVALCVVAIAGVFGHSYRAAVYNGSASVSPSVTPHPSPSPTCTPLTPAQVADIQKHIKGIEKQIADINAQIKAEGDRRIALWGNVEKLQAQLNNTTNPSLRKSLLLQISATNSQVSSLGKSIEALQNQASQLQIQKWQLQDLLNQKCSPQGSPKPA